MRAFFESLSHLYKFTFIFLYLVLVEVVLQIRSVPQSLRRSCKQSSFTREYLARIEKNSSTFMFRKKIRPDLNECAICLLKLEEGDRLREIQCKHVFHKDCLGSWLQHHLATCPLCRGLVLPEEEMIELYRLQAEQEQVNSSNEHSRWLPALLGGNLHGLY
ncbi:Zinc finger, RING-type [Dillenia turbinata]|uniref:Zinc finger, RING-type n=1 Tax=Dillenia turbinata TaxID=194707 RepID=A0AAN8VQ72_9MAGN